MSEIGTVAVMTPGDMGGAVARLLSTGGLRVITNLEGRSERTRGLALAAGVQDVGNDRAMVEEADLILSILVPDQALAFAQRLAPAIKAGGTRAILVDCNAIAPDTAKQAAAVIEEAGGQFVDAGIIGPPPREGAKPRFYASGAMAERFAELRRYGLDVRLVSERVGDASSVKMCYASLTKGSAALMTQLLVAAERLGVRATLHAEFEGSQGEQLQRMHQWVPSSVPKAFRWVGEMQEIASTFESAGVPGDGFHAAARTWQAVADTELGQMRVEEWARADLPFDEVVRRLAQQLR